MKIGGVQVTAPKPLTLVLPHGDTQVVFKAQCVLDYSEFEERFPKPEPRRRVYPDGREELLTEEPEYLKRVSEYSELKLTWTTLKSLSATPNLEWETVDPQDSSTWKNYRTELESAFSPYEMMRIQALVFEAVGLDQGKIDQATKDFLAGKGAKPVASSSPSTEPANTPSGTPANAGE